MTEEEADKEAIVYANDRFMKMQEKRSNSQIGVQKAKPKDMQNCEYSNTNYYFKQGFAGHQKLCTLSRLVKKEKAATVTELPPKCSPLDYNCEYCSANYASIRSLRQHKVNCWKKPIGGFRV
jgi:hypothetical protein